MTVKAIKKIPFEHLIFDEDFNARKEYEGIEELAESIETDGLLQPIGVVAKKAKEVDGQQSYYIIYGFRRYLALSKLREKHGDNAFSELDVVIVDGTVQDLKQKNLKENLDRKSLKPHEIVAAIKGMVNSGLEQRDIAQRLGRPQSWVSYHNKVATKLGVEARKAFEANDLTLEQALHIADVPEEQQSEVVEAVVTAETRRDARKIAKTASKEQGGRRTYANKGRPTAKNLTQFVQDASFDGTGPSESVDNKFWNGVAAGIRVALGETEFDKLAVESNYCDTDYGKAEKSNGKEKKPKAKRGRKKKVKEDSEEDTTEGSVLSV